jgi:phage-related protein
MAREKISDAKVSWEGDSLEVVKAFPPAVRQELGFDIRRLQQGTMPHDSRPMPSVGRGVFELRQRDGSGTAAGRQWLVPSHLSRSRW